MDNFDLRRYDGVPIVKNDTFNAAGPFSDARDSTAAEEIEFLDREAAHNRGAFKTPSLRNVSETPPYMHGGHFDTLEEVVEFYANLEPSANVGHREESMFVFLMDEQQKQDLVAFLESLTGEPVPETYKSQPDSPIPD